VFHKLMGVVRTNRFVAIDYTKSKYPYPHIVELMTHINLKV
jgi:hypothetical protein